MNPAPDSGAAKKRILIVDDDDSVRLTMKILLRTKGYEVLQAESGIRGLEMARTELPQLILLDVNMSPGPDGCGVLKLLRADPSTSTIKVIMITGVPEKLRQRTEKEIEPDDFLEKPFEANVFLSAVHAQLERGA